MQRIAVVRDVSGRVARSVSSRSRGETAGSNSMLRIFLQKMLHPPASSTKTRAASAMLYSRLPRAPRPANREKPKTFASQPPPVEAFFDGTYQTGTEIQIAWRA